VQGPHAPTGPFTTPVNSDPCNTSPCSHVIESPSPGTRQPLTTSCWVPIGDFHQLKDLNQDIIQTTPWFVHVPSTFAHNDVLNLIRGFSNSPTALIFNMPGILGYLGSSSLHPYEQLAERMELPSGPWIPASDNSNRLATTHLIATLIVQIIAVLFLSARIYTRTIPVWRFTIDDYVICFAFVSRLLSSSLERG
jgi:hypothetical protein